MPLFVVGLVAVLAVLSSGCPDRPISRADPVQAKVVTKDIPIGADLDLLFVIDNSQSTRDKQTLFAQNYQNFVTRLESLTTRPNMHLGVVTSSVDLGPGASGFSGCRATTEDGRLQSASRDPGQPCAPTSNRFLSDLARPDGSRQVNYTGTLAEALTCISRVGETGCGFEAPLEAMKRALDGSRPENAGFVRRGALLAVVILADEDDCSGDPRLYEGGAGGPEDFRCTQAAYRCDQSISTSAPGAYTGCKVRRDSLLFDPTAYTTFLSGLKGPSNVVIALIAGTPEAAIRTGPLAFPGHTQSLALQPSCDATILGTTAIARPALRLDEFRRGFGDHGLFRTVCQSDYSQAVDDIATLLFAALSPCLEGALDTEDVDDAPGLQLDCQVSDVQDPEGGQVSETQIPRCHMLAADRPDRGGDAACWWVKPNPSCATATHLELQVERASAPAEGTRVRVSCVSLAL